MSHRATVLSGYRSLLRASRIAFEGDHEAVKGAALQLRSTFEENRGIRDQEALEEAIEAMNDAHDFLVHNVVQAKLTEEGNYAVEIDGEKTKGKVHTDVHVVKSSDDVPDKPVPRK